MSLSIVEKRRLISLAGAILKSDGPKGTVVAVVNTGHEDLQGDTIAAGAWGRVISMGQRPPVFWNHDIGGLPLGSVRDLQELRPGDPRIPDVSGKSNGSVGGLLAKIAFALDTSRGHDAYVLASENHVKEWSVQIAVDPAHEQKNSYKGTRLIKEVHELLELSMVVKGASLGTRTLEAKAAFSRVMPAWLKTVAEMAEDQTILAVEEAERYRHRRENEREAVREGARAGLAIAVKSLNDMIDRAMEVKEIERMSGQFGNFYQSRPARQLTAEQARIREIRRMAGHVSS